jgi:hypothetical protein
MAVPWASADLILHDHLTFKELYKQLCLSLAKNNSLLENHQNSEYITHVRMSPMLWQAWLDV